MTPAHTIAVLGLGTMGSAMARRLASTGLRVTAWSRRSAPAGVSVEDKPGDAVRAADIVLLALFDGAACAEVLAACRDDLPPGCVVVNTSTVAASEAEALERTVTGHGHGYLHCPVLGSVPAVETGTLTLLAGAAGVPESLTALTALGRFVPCGDTTTAATIKLVANSALAAALVALGDVVARGLRVGLDRALLLDVLAHTALGGLAVAKRPWLDGSPAGTRFAAAALTKDIDLLVATDPLSRSLLEDLRAAPTPDGADIGAIAASLGSRGTWPVDPGSRLDATPTVPRDTALLAPLVAYARGHATGDPAHFHDAFRPTAHVEGLRAGEFVSWSLEDYCRAFPGTPAGDEPFRRRTITALRRHGSVANATMTLQHGPDTFTDVFLLVEQDDTWRIANKAYHRAPTDTQA